MDPKEVYFSKPWLEHYPKEASEFVTVPDKSVPELFNEVVEKYGRIIEMRRPEYSTKGYLITIEDIFKRK